MTGCPIKRIITFKQAVVYGSIQIIDNYDNDVTQECQFSWSTDGVCWTSWVNYEQYMNLAENLDSDYFLRILIFGGLNAVYYNGLLTDCYSVCLDQSNVFLKDFCEGTNLFQPYTGLDCALELQKQLSDSVICMFGIPIYYLRVTPNPESVDYTFKEWTLHDVVDIKQMKLMIPDGQMPSSNPRLTDFDFDWDIDWETELSKSQFAKAFGDTAFPKQRDLVYIPLMKRLWEVNSAYDEKNEGLMWRPTTWKLALVKYNEKTNVDKGNFEDLIDGWLVNKYEDTFGENEKEEQTRESGIDQLSAPQFAATNLYNIFAEDSMRKQISKDYTIQDKIYCHHNNIVARNIYRFKNENGCVTYQKPICGKSGWLSFIIETPGSGEGMNDKKEILRFGELFLTASFNGKGFTLEWADLSLTIKPFSTYMVILKWNGDNRTIDFNIYEYTHNANIPIYMLRPEMNWWDFEHPVYKRVGDFNKAFNSSYWKGEPLNMKDGKYDEDWSLKGECRITPWPLAMTNIKYYRGWMSDEDIFKECVKYTTNHEQCIINDLARPVLDGHGYAVK